MHKKLKQFFKNEGKRRWLILYCKRNLEKIKKEYRIIQEFLQDKYDSPYYQYMIENQEMMFNFLKNSGIKAITEYDSNLLSEQSLNHKKLIHEIIENNIDYEEIQKELENVDKFFTFLYENSPAFTDLSLSSEKKEYQELKEKYYKMEDRIDDEINYEKIELIFDRKKLIDNCWFIYGEVGSGKTFLLKNQINSVITKYPDDDIIIVDTNAEYKTLVEKYGGKTIKLSLNSEIKINPFEITLTEEYETTTERHDQIDLIVALIESFDVKITDNEAKIVYNLLKVMYNEYIENYKKGIISQLNFEKFWNELYPLSTSLALRIEKLKNYNIFANETNIELKEKIINFDISELNDSNLKKAALLFISNFTTNRAKENMISSRYTWFYMEETSTFLKDEVTRNFIHYFVIKRGRTRGLIFTGIIYDLEDILKNRDVKMILHNRSHSFILKQSENDRTLLQELFQFSSKQSKYMNKLTQGTGVILNNEDYPRRITPFKF